MQNTGIDIYVQQLKSKIDNERYNALKEMLEITNEKVVWFEKYKSEFINKLKDDNSYQRSIGMMILCNLAKNDSEKREFLGILPLLMELIDDEKFITQRQYLQNIWKVAVVNDEYKKRIAKQLEEEFLKCKHKKHYNLLRIDIISSLTEIMKAGNDDKIRLKISNLIEKEEDTKNRKKLLMIMK